MVSSCRESAERIVEELGCDGFTVDLSKADDGKRFIDYVLTKYGRVDIQVNNMGVQY